MEKKNYVKIDNRRVITELTDGLCTVTRSQVAEIIKKQLKRQNSVYQFSDEILDTSIRKLKNSTQYRIEPFLGGKDTLISVYGENGELNVIPCLWVLMDMTKNDYLDLKNIYRGKSPEAMSYSEDNVTYVFFYVTKDNLGIMPKALDKTKYYLDMASKTKDNSVFYATSVFVTDSVETANTLVEMTKGIACNIAVIKYNESPYEKPEKIAYIINGKRVK